MAWLINKRIAKWDDNDEVTGLYSIGYFDSNGGYRTLISLIDDSPEGALRVCHYLNGGSDNITEIMSIVNSNFVTDNSLSNPVRLFRKESYN